MELGLRTQFEFRLPMGYVAEDGGLHRRGEMRLATARDEIEPLRDQRVAQNEAYLTVLVLSRVVTRIGDITNVTPEVIEGLFAADLAYLQDFYGIANFGDQSQLPVDFDDEDETSGEMVDVRDEEPLAEVEGMPQRRSSIEEVLPAMEA